MPDNKHDSSPALLVIGSSNTDMVVKTPRLPAPGETILGGAFFMNAGGKGANQAVACARLGGNVIFICKTGTDIFGKQSVELFRKEGINVNYILTDTKNPSGVALITVDDNGENCISVASGANASLSVEDLLPLQSIIESAAMVLMQLEIPVETVEYVAQVARDKNIPVLLNPAPATSLSEAFLKNISIITPNEIEAHLLTGIHIHDKNSAETAAVLLHEKGIETVIITLGADGALLFHNGLFTQIPGVPVKAVDTTAAGDIFNGALAVALVEGHEMTEAIHFASRAAAISVTRMGAQSSAPFRNELI